MKETFATYFERDGKWFLYSFGVSRDAVPEVLAAIWRHEKCDGVRAVPTPEVLTQLCPSES